MRLKKRTWQRRRGQAQVVLGLAALLGLVSFLGLIIPWRWFLLVAAVVLAGGGVTISVSEIVLKHYQRAFSSFWLVSAGVGAFLLEALRDGPFILSIETILVLWAGWLFLGALAVPVSAVVSWFKNRKVKSNQAKQKLA